jgi:hypothetical protein
MHGELCRAQAELPQRARDAVGGVVAEQHDIAPALRIDYAQRRRLVGGQ